MLNSKLKTKKIWKKRIFATYSASVKCIKPRRGRSVQPRQLLISLSTLIVAHDEAIKHKLGVSELTNVLLSVRYCKWN